MISSFDINILNFIRDNLSNPILDNIMILFTTLGDRGIIWITIGIILLVQKKYRKIGFILLIALLINFVIGEVLLKNIIHRPRVFITNPNINILINPPESYSFPSGHTASSFAAATVLGYYFKKYRYVFYVIASLIAFSRIYLYVHYPSDVLAGVLLGIVCALFTIKVIGNKITETYKT